jgi:hypothetical protein
VDVFVSFRDSLVFRSLNSYIVLFASAKVKLAVWLAVTFSLLIDCTQETQTSALTF